jgi:hypothetical protein
LGPESPLLGQNSPFLASLAGTLELKSEKANAYSNNVASVAFSPDGKTIVSGSYDQTIKVWDAGAFWARDRPSLAKADRSCLPSQPHSSSRPSRPTPIATWSHQWHFPQMERRSSLVHGTRRSKSGTQVRFGPRIAPSWPKLTLPVLTPVLSFPERDRIDQCGLQGPQCRV